MAELPDYPAIAAKLGTTLTSEEYVRRVTRPGIRRYLHREAMIQNHDLKPQWRRYWAAQQLVADWLEKLGVRLFEREISPYRRRLKAMLVNVPTSPEREEALKWAMR